MPISSAPAGLARQSIGSSLTRTARAREEGRPTATAFPEGRPRCRSGEYWEGASLRLWPLTGLLAFSLSVLSFFSPSAAAAVRWSEVNDQPAAWYASDEARAIAANVRLYQDATGGWPKNRDMTVPPPAKIVPPDSHDTVAEVSEATIDNGATTTQVEFLARVHSAAEDAAARDAVLRGLDYLLVSQYPNGGWPQFYPLRKGYYTHITYNDNATANVLAVLRGVRDARPPYAWVDAARRKGAELALARALDCILRTQVRQDGKLVGWCAQHDENTFEPVWARNFEPPSLSGHETVGLVRFLMTIEQPSPAVVAAIEGAVAWLEASKVTGWRVETFTAEDGKRDRRAVADPSAPVLWARFYELGTNRPIFIGRDRVIRYDYNEIERERRVGYVYLGTWPAALLEREYPKWRAKQGE